MTDIVVHTTLALNGAETTTVLRGEEYLSETRVDGTVISRARNTDRFHAGMAHMAFHLSWSQAAEPNLRQAVIEAREEGEP